MLKNKKFITVFIVETIIPWIVGILGLFTIFFFNDMGDYYRERLMDEYERANSLFEGFMSSTMWAGGIIAFLLFITGFVAFIIMIVKLCSSKKEKYSVMMPLIIWIWSGMCASCTLTLMFFTNVFTYGMSV